MSHDFERAQTSIGLSPATDTGAAAANIRARTPLPSPAPAQQRRRTSGIPQFSDNPLGAIGFVLESVGAGLTGKEQPSERFRRAAQDEEKLQIQREGLRLRQDGLALKAMDFFVDRIAGLSPTESEAMISSVVQTVNLPGLEGPLRELLKQTEQKRRDFIAAAKKNPKLFAGLSAAVEAGMPISDAFKIMGKAAEFDVLTGRRVKEAGLKRKATAEAALEVSGPPPIETTTVLLKNGETKTFNKRDSEFQAAIDDGAIKVGFNVQATNVDDLLPGKKLAAEIQKRMFTAKQGLARLDLIKESFKPEFLEFFPRLGFAALKLSERAGVSLSEETKIALSEFAVFTRRLLSNLNLYIKDITGAQMSATEAVRLIKAQPNEEDSPTTFSAKLNDTTNELRASAFRMMHLLRMGFTKKTMDESVADAFPLSRWMPPPGEDDAKLINIDPDGNPIFQRSNGLIFKVVPD